MSRSRRQKQRKIRSSRKTRSTPSARRSLLRLTRKGPKKQCGGNQELIEAAKVGDLATVNRLLEAGAHPNGQNPNNPEARIGWHQNPLVVAARNGHLNVVQRLLEAGAEVNFQGSGHAVFWATQQGHLAILQRLLQEPNVNVNIAASFGEFPLSMAVQEYNIPIIQLLLAAGADPQFRPVYIERGEEIHIETALEVAQQRGYQDVVQILQGQPVPLPLRTNLNVPEGSENTVYYEPIQDGDELVDFHGESGFGRYYTQAAFNGSYRLTRNPATRAPIRPQNIRYHVARIVPGMQSHSP